MLSKEAVVGYVCEYLKDLREELRPGEAGDLVARIGSGEATVGELTEALERAGFVIDPGGLRSVPSLPGGRVGEPDAEWVCPAGRCDRSWRRRFVGQSVPHCEVGATPLRRA
ncbi:hypothetical protein [Kitasatospora sp. NPDC056184]|uniref:hypothetical protein n=1 Tax=Kitasatospora sp. NPDC056184 TaxID=3345738 RepID=UPI0035D7B782